MSCSVLWDQDDIFGHLVWVKTEDGSLFVWLISGHASLKSGVCEVNPYSNVLSSDTDGASFESMQHEERITLWE